MLQAVPNTFAPIFVLRFLLGKISQVNISSINDLYKTFSYKGMLESCVAPILILIISMFYKKNEQVCVRQVYPKSEIYILGQSRRISWFYVMV